MPDMLVCNAYPLKCFSTTLLTGLVIEYNFIILKILMKLLNLICINIVNNFLVGNGETPFKMEFVPGSLLEARDFNNEWFSAKVVEVDLDDREGLVHFQNWSSRYDEWISMDSARLRPVSQNPESVLQIHFITSFNLINPSTLFSMNQPQHVIYLSFFWT